MKALNQVTIASVGQLMLDELKNSGCSKKEIVKLLDFCTYVLNQDPRKENLVDVLITINRKFACLSEFYRPNSALISYQQSKRKELVSLCHEMVNRYQLINGTNLVNTINSSLIIEERLVLGYAELSVGYKNQKTVKSRQLNSVLRVS